MLGSLLHFEKLDKKAKSGIRDSKGNNETREKVGAINNEDNNYVRLRVENAADDGMGYDANLYSHSLNNGRSPKSHLNKTWAGSEKEKGNSAALSRVTSSQNAHRSSSSIILSNGYRDRSRSFDAFDSSGKTRSLSSSDLNAAVNSLAKIRINGSRTTIN